MVWRGFALCGLLVRHVSLSIAVVGEEKKCRWSDECDDLSVTYRFLSRLSAIDCRVSIVECRLLIVECRFLIVDF